MARAELLTRTPEPEISFARRGFEKLEAPKELLEKNYSDFRLEYKENVPDQALIDDLVSFLGEYYFKVPKFKYQLEFSNGNIKDPRKKESMSDIAEKAIHERIAKNKTYSRELAEKQGIESLENQLKSAKHGDSIVWTSPPGPKEEGYGDYGFIFLGELSGKDLQMTAIHIDSPTIEQFNNAMYLFTGEKTNYKTAEEFIANPRVIKERLDEGYADALLKKAFSFKPNEEEQKKFSSIMRQMASLNLEFIDLAKSPFKPKSEKIKGLYSIINYALQLKKEYEEKTDKGNCVIVDFKPKPVLADIQREYGHKPDKVAGSCPNSDDDNPFTSSNILSRNSFINKLLGEEDMDYDFDKEGPCKKCNADVMCGPCGICRSCDLAIRASQKFSLN